MRIAFIALTTAVAVAFAPTQALARTGAAETTRTAEHDVERLHGADVESLKARAQEAIDRRLATIDRLRARVTDHPHVTGPHQGELLAELGRSGAGLRALSAEIDRATTIEELRVLVAEIATDFRIYLVVVPKVHQVLGSDTVVAAGERLDGVADSLAAWIERAVANGADTSEARVHLADMTEEIRQAVVLGEPVAGAVLPLTPSDWPTPAGDVLAQGRADLIEAGGLLREARDSAKETVAALREALGS